VRLPDWKERLEAFCAGTGGTRAEITQTVGRTTVTIDGRVVVDETPEEFILENGGMVRFERVDP
jgi:hypothetical protein